MSIFKATVFIRLRSQVDDSPGNAVRDACKRMSKLYVNKLRIGKVIDVWMEAPDKEYAVEQLSFLSDRFLANTVMEDWSYEIEELDALPEGVHPSVK